jgi:signal transduction histidine kinase
MSESSLPLLTVLESILAWQRDPGEAQMARLVDAVGSVISAAGGRGVYLLGDPTLLPGLSVGWGTLTRPPASHAGSDAGAAAPIELRGQDGASVTGSLWIDAATGPDAQTVRIIELAVEAAWSRADARQTADRLRALDAATRAIASLESLEHVLQDIADRVRDLIGAEYAALGIVDEFGVIERFVTSGISRQQREAIGPLIVEENRAYRIPDIGAHEHSSGFPPNHPPMRSFLGVPISVKGRSVGNFYLTNKRNAEQFSEADERLVDMFALHAGVAIENARLHEQVQRMAVIDERTRIGKDLHDGIIQAIYAVGLSLEDVPDLMAEVPAEAAQRVDAAIESINLSIRDIRNFIYGLRPEAVDGTQVVAGLAALAEEVRHGGLIDITANLDPAADPGLDPQTGNELLNLVREALSNAVRHAHGRRISISLSATEEGSRLEIADDGIGFDPAQLVAAGHHGLANMRARADSLGGRLEIRTAPDEGTTVIVELPRSTLTEHDGSRR